CARSSPEQTLTPTLSRFAGEGVRKRRARRGAVRRALPQLRGLRVRRGARLAVGVAGAVFEAFEAAPLAEAGGHGLGDGAGGDLFVLAGGDGGVGALREGEDEVAGFLKGG